MKLSKLFIASSLLIISQSSFAMGYLWVESKTVEHGNVFSSKEEAFKNGFNMLSEYKSKNSKMLHDKLSPRLERTDKNSFSIDNLKLNIDEFFVGDGKAKYQPVVEIKYKYKKREEGGSK